MCAATPLTGEEAEDLMFDVAPARLVCSAMIVGRCDVCGAALFLSADGEAIGYLCDHEEE